MISVWETLEWRSCKPINKAHAYKNAKAYSLRQTDGQTEKDLNAQCMQSLTASEWATFIERLRCNYAVCILFFSFFEFLFNWNVWVHSVEVQLSSSLFRFHSIFFDIFLLFVREKKESNKKDFRARALNDSIFLRRLENDIKRRTQFIYLLHCWPKHLFRIPPKSQRASSTIKQQSSR